MTRSQMETEIAKQQNIPAATVKRVLDRFIDNTVEALQKGENVTIAGFGRFEMRERKSKAYTNPKTGEKSQLEPKKIPGFKVSGLFKERVGE